MLMLSHYRESIQTSASILSNNINSIVEHLSRNADILNRTVVYPSTNYPGRTQEGLLGQLLRKKLEPQVETWVEEGRAIQEGAADSKEEDVEELWVWGKEWIGQRVVTYIQEEAGDNYTVEERERGIENVNTGLRRKFDEESEDEEEDEDKEMEDVGVEVTSVAKTTSGQVEFGLEEVRKGPAAKSRSVDEILKLATSRADQHPR
jgi:mediator of RNA polymerase II transcription subunit 8